MILMNVVMRRANPWDVPIEELRARFEEQANIQVAERLQAVGANVVAK